MTLDFKQFEFHLLNTALCQVWFIFEIGPLVWEKMLKILKVNKRTVRLTDGHAPLNCEMLHLMKLYRSSIGDTGHNVDKTIEMLIHTSSLIRNFRDRRPITHVSDNRLQGKNDALQWFIIRNRQSKRIR